MPVLYVVSPRCPEGFKVYDRNLNPIKTSIFDKFKIKDLSPLSKRQWVANFWHFRQRKHSVFSWNDDGYLEHTVFIPGILTWQDALAAARLEFEGKGVIPSATFFRLSNYESAHLYD